MINCTAVYTAVSPFFLYDRVTFFSVYDRVTRCDHPYRRLVIYIKKTKKYYKLVEHF